VLEGDVHDPAVAARLDVRQAEVRQADHREEEQLDRRLVGLGAETECGTTRRAAAVVDQDVDPAEGLERLLHEPLEIARRRDVAAHGQRA